MREREAERGRESKSESVWERRERAHAAPRLDEEHVGVADVLAELDVALAVVEAPDGRLPPPPWFHTALGREGAVSRVNIRGAGDERQARMCSSGEGSGRRGALGGDRVIFVMF